MCDLIVSVPDHCLSFYFDRIFKTELKGRIYDDFADVASI